MVASEFRISCWHLIDKILFITWYQPILNSESDFFHVFFAKGPKIELVSKELNQLAAILQHYVGGLIFMK